MLVLVYSRAGRVLLLRRVRPAGFWQSVTGSLEWHETEPAATARRELLEETGIDAVARGLELIDCDTRNRFPIRPAWRHRYPPGVRHNLEHVFRVELAEELPVLLDPGEHTEYLWLSREQALARVSSYTNRDAIERFVR